MKVTIATAPCSWGVWYADGTPSRTPYDVFLDQASEGGYKALELGPDGYLPTDINRLREELTRRNLEICAGTACYTFSSFESFAEVKPKVEALCRRLQSFDAKYLVTMDDSPIGYNREIKKNMSNDSWKQIFSIFKEMGEYSKNEFGINTVFHQHAGTLIETEAETIRVMDEANLDLCFDTGHYAVINGDWKSGDRSALDFMRKYASRIPYLHFKNVNGAVRKRIIEEQLPIGEARKLDVMCDLSDGIIDYEAFRDLLIELNFFGIGVIEQDVPNATTAEAFEIAKRNLGYLQDIHLIE